MNNMNATIFTNTTKQICYCSFISMFLIVLFMISPLNQFVIGSSFMKIIIIILLGYTLYLNTNQIRILQNTDSSNMLENIKSQLNMNVMCSYMFSIFVGLLLLFVVKSFF